MSDKSQYVIWAHEAAARYGVPINYFMRQITMESGWDPNAVSPAGAVGIAQFEPATARGMKINPRNPRAALFAAARLDAENYHQYGNWRDAFAAYNAGPAAVRSGHLPAETQHYVNAIVGNDAPVSAHYGGYQAPGTFEGGAIAKGSKGYVPPKIRIYVPPPEQVKIPTPNAAEADIPDQTFQLPGQDQAVKMDTPYVAPYKQAAANWQTIASQPGVSPETMQYTANAHLAAGANPLPKVANDNAFGMTPQLPDVQAQEASQPIQPTRASGKAGGFLPGDARYKRGRADQGRDFQTDPGGAILAPGAGVVVAVKSDPNGFGPDYPVVRFTSGPYAGRTMYIGHTHAQLSPGQHFGAGAVISRTGTRPVGNASVPGWAEIGFAPGGTPGPFGQQTPFA